MTPCSITLRWSSVTIRAPVRAIVPRGIGRGTCNLIVAAVVFFDSTSYEEYRGPLTNSSVVALRQRGELPPSVLTGVTGSLPLRLSMRVGVVPVPISGNGSRYVLSPS